ncbi:MAG: fibronectin type III domain-containing protein [Syntrophobacteraceae bacterium]
MKLRLSVVFFSILCVAALANAASLKMAWTPCNNPEVVGYRIHYGTEAGNYTKTVQVEGRLTSKAVVDNLEDGKTYFFVITSYNAKGEESPYSYEMSNAPRKNQNQGKRPLAGPPCGLSSSSSSPRAVKVSPSRAAANRAPSPDKIPATRKVAKTPEGKILPSR